MERQEVVYKHEWAINFAREQVSKVSLEISRTDKLEHRVINQVGNYLLSPSGSIRHKRFIRRLVMQEIETAKRLYRSRATELLADISFEDDEGQAVEYEPEDVLADINSQELELKQTIELLAQNDRRRETILTAWANGYTDDREISGILADTLGGKSESHRKFIQRFRNSCRTQLYAQAI